MEDQNLIYILVGCIGGMGLLSAFNYFTKTSQTNVVINKIRETQVDLNENLANVSKQTIHTLNEIRESMGSLFFVILDLVVLIILPLCILASWGAIKSNVKEYMIAFIFLEVFVIAVSGSSTWFIETKNVIDDQVTDPTVTITNALSPTSSAGGTVFPTDAIDWFTTPESSEFIDKMTLFNSKKQKFAQILVDDMTKLIKEGRHLKVPEESEFAIDKFLDPETIYALADNSSEIANMLSRLTQI